MRSIDELRDVRGRLEVRDSLSLHELTTGARLLSSDHQSSLAPEEGTRVARWEGGRVARRNIS